jgi:mRNA interferase HicA
MLMNSGQFQRYLAKRGCVFETHKGGSGHLTVTRVDEAGNRWKSQVPTHGGSKQLGTGLMNKILKDLRLK